MTLRQFIKENRRNIDHAIRIQVPNYSINDAERKQWILNDEPLYRWARSCGVKI